MKAWLLDSIGSLDSLRFGEIADPSPAPGEALLKVEFAALNPPTATSPKGSIRRSAVSSHPGARRDRHGRRRR